MIIIYSIQAHDRYYDSLPVLSTPGATYLLKDLGFRRRHNESWYLARIVDTASLYCCMKFLLSSDVESSSGRNRPSDRSLDAEDGSAPMKVLVIDDDDTMRDIIGYILRRLGVEFDTVRSGEEGLSKLSKGSYKLVFLDLVLHTGSHGIEIYNKICCLQEVPSIVFMTASGSKEPIFEEAEKLGPPILRKPFSSDEIKRVIDEAKKRRNTL